MDFVTKDEYEKAQEKVNKFEKRQQKLKEVKEEIADVLKIHKHFKFKFRKEMIIFSYVDLKKDVHIGVANCNPNDKYNKELGKLIAIRKAYGEDIKDLVELVEPKNIDVNFNFKKTMNEILDNYGKSIYYKF